MEIKTSRKNASGPATSLTNITMVAMGKEHLAPHRVKMFTLLRMMPKFPSRMTGDRIQAHRRNIS